MNKRYGLFLGDDQIPVINWINRHGPPEGRDLRFTIPLEAKSKLQSNPDATYTLKRGEDSWDFQLVSVELHSTGTNGVRAVGRVKKPSRGLKELSNIGLDRKSSTGVGIPKLDGSPSEATVEKPNLDKLKQKVKRERKTTVHGGPVSEAEEQAAPEQPAGEPEHADAAEPPAVAETTPAEADAIEKEKDDGGASG